MGAIQTWWRAIGLQFKLRILIQGCVLVILLIAQFWLSDKLERMALDAAHERTVAVADGVNNGLNTLMDIQIGGKDAISAFWDMAIEPVLEFRFTIRDSFANGNACANIGTFSTVLEGGNQADTK